MFNKIISSEHLGHIKGLTPKNFLNLSAKVRFLDVQNNFFATLLKDFMALTKFFPRFLA